jgi:serine phosphatase RsbU (regulator of sigma subunit)
MDNQLKYIPILEKISVFSSTDYFYLKKIAALCKEVDCRKDEILFSKGDNSDGLYIVIKGNLKVHDRDYVYAQMKEGDIIGEYSLIDTEPRSATITSENDSQLLFLSREEFNLLIDNQPAILKNILTSFTTRLRHHNQVEEIQNKEKIAIEQVKNELFEQQEFIMHQGDKMAEQKAKMTQSINYAKNIQKALLPDQETLEKIWGDIFVLFKPKDIVSGDFYWTFDSDDYSYIAAADCTGHGVPGAFMCMLGVSGLNQIALKIDGKPDTGKILDDLRTNVISTLNQRRSDSSSKDGMDIAFITFDKIKKRILYSGAYNPLYLIRNDELLEYKANRMPIGVYIRDDRPFKSEIIDIQKGDVVYIFSDGYYDQFGGDTNRKMGSQKFKQLLLKMHKDPMETQRKKLQRNLKDWRGSNRQLDDIVVIGIRF